MALDAFVAAYAVPANGGEWAVLLVPVSAVLFGCLTAFFSWRNNVNRSKRDEPLTQALKDALNYNHQQMLGLQQIFSNTTWRIDGLSQQLNSLVVALHRREP